jgi:hypothetical protein
MRASRGMGNISPSKMPKAKRAKHRDDTNFDEYSRGGKVGMKRKKKNERDYTE